MAWSTSNKLVGGTSLLSGQMKACVRLWAYHQKINPTNLWSFCTKHFSSSKKL